MRIGNPLNNVKSFVSKSVNGSDDVRSKDQEEDKIDSDLGKIEDGLRKIDAELDIIDQTTQLKPPSLSNVSNGQLLVAGATAGAIVGGAYGLLSNTATSWAAQPSIRVDTVKHDIIRPELGSPSYTETRIPLYRDVTTYDANGNPHTQKELTGYRLERTANIDEKVVGQYKTQTAQVNNAGISNPVWDGLQGMAVGAAAGSVLAGGIIVARKLTGKGDYNGSPARETQGDFKVIAKMAGMGAVGGAAIGGLSGMLASANAKTETIVTQSPVFETRSIGQIPASHDVGTANPGRVDVIRQVPKMDGGVLGTGLGKDPVVNETRTEVTAGGGVTLMSGLIGGAVVGAGMGAAAGVLTNVLRKTL